MKKVKKRKGKWHARVEAKPVIH